MEKKLLFLPYRKLTYEESPSAKKESKKKREISCP
jgi:hypothetical protein